MFASSSLNGHGVQGQSSRPGEGRIIDAVRGARSVGDCQKRLGVPICDVSHSRRHGGPLVATRAAHDVHMGSANGFVSDPITEEDIKFLHKAAECAVSALGEAQPHPNAGCILVRNNEIICEAHQRAQGTTSAEVQAVSLAGDAARGSTAYLNLESGDCHGEMAAIRALTQGGVQRVVIGLKHPLQHLRGHAVQALQTSGLSVAVLGDAACSASAAVEQEAMLACLHANEHLVHRAVLKRPLSILKYAMTLDGKIAATTGHSAWVSSSTARQEVFAMRAMSDAVIVGGNTVRRDNPRLTTRRESGHAPVRIVMSRTLDLPDDANLWDVTLAPTIVMTQRGARRDFQQGLRDRGVEVVEFDFLTPGNVADYCYERGFLQCFWECGGTLAAPAIAGEVIHKVMAFVAPKIIGGARAPTPCGDLGFVEMTQAVQMSDTAYKQVGPDLMITGYLPSSGGLLPLEEALSAPDAKDNGTEPTTSILSQTESATVSAGQRKRGGKRKQNVASFYKAWDRWGAFGNFSPHPIWLPDGPGPHAKAGNEGGEEGMRMWASVEHYYQAQKVAGVSDPEALALYEEIAAARSPEEAACVGRLAQRQKPHLIRSDWEDQQLAIMEEALTVKFTLHDGPRKLLLSTAEGPKGDLTLVENSPHDFFWGCGADGTGKNNLGRLLMKIREKFLAEQDRQVLTGEATMVGC